MTKYYEAQRRVFAIVDKKMQTFAYNEKQKKLDVRKLIFDLLRDHPVSERAIKKRVIEFVEFSSSKLTLTDDFMVVKE